MADDDNLFFILDGETTNNDDLAISHEISENNSDLLSATVNSPNNNEADLSTKSIHLSKSEVFIHKSASEPVYNYSRRRSEIPNLIDELNELEKKQEKKATEISYSPRISTPRPSTMTTTTSTPGYGGGGGERSSLNRKPSYSNNNKRYHVSDLKHEYKPGEISQELRDALNLRDNELPWYIYRMRHLGYPPGWLRYSLRDPETSVSQVIDESHVDEEEENGKNTKRNSNNENSTYDASMFISYPGFNVPVKSNMNDFHYQLGGIAQDEYMSMESFIYDLEYNYYQVINKPEWMTKDNQLQQHQHHQSVPGSSSSLAASTAAAPAAASFAIEPETKSKKRSKKRKHSSTVTTTNNNSPSTSDANSKKKKRKKQSKQEEDDDDLEREREKILKELADAEANEEKGEQEAEKEKNDESNYELTSVSMSEGSHCITHEETSAEINLDSFSRNIQQVCMEEVTPARGTLLKVRDVLQRRRSLLNDSA